MKRVTAPAPRAAADQGAFEGALRLLLNRGERVWRGDWRFDRHVRAYTMLMVGMAKANEG